MYDDEGNLIPPLVAMTRRCIHFIYWEYSFVCKAGIHMIDLCNGGQPCFRDCTMAGGLPCDKAEFMTLEEAKANEAQYLADRWKRMQSRRQ